MSEIRKDPLSNTWVIIAPERGARPTDLKARKPQVASREGCPLCDSPEIRVPIDPNDPCMARLDDKGNWLTKVINNKYPALTTDQPLNQAEVDGLYHMLAGVGGHEIMVETPVHEHKPSNLPAEQIVHVLENYRCKYEYWRKDPRISYLSIFKNHGKRAGASLQHAHSQLIATPLVPPRVASKLDESEDYYETHNKCLMCKVIETEKQTNKRIVKENDSFICFMPYASRFPYEMLIVPKKHSASFELETNEVNDLAEMISDVYKKIDKLLGDPPFNYILDVAPLRTPGLPYFHWHIELILRLSQPAGFEWGSGVYINSVSPEDGAKQLREVNSE